MIKKWTLSLTQLLHKVALSLVDVAFPKVTFTFTFSPIIYHQVAPLRLRIEL